MTRISTPFAVIALAALAGLGTAAVALFLALYQPWLGLRLVPDAIAGHVRIDRVMHDGPANALTAGGPLSAISGITLESGDLVEEPDVAESYLALQRFLGRQSEISAALRSGLVTLRAAEGSGEPVVVTPAPRRPVSSIPAVFWVQILAGFVSFIVGAWVWSLRRSELSTALLAGAGAGILISAYPAAVYSTRELALPGGTLHVLMAINRLGTFVFGVAMMALFLTYPRRLVPLRALWSLPVVYAAIWTMDTFHLLLPGPSFGVHLPAVTLMVGIIIGGVLQYRTARGDPAARAAVRWFALSVCICAGTFVTLILVPNVFGIMPPASQGLAFALFGILFLGVAAGVARYRLFDLEDWAFTVLYTFGAAVLLLVFDGLLIWLMALERPVAFALSLLVVALVYLPFRDWLARRLMRVRDIDREDLFRRIVDVALAPAPTREDGWQQLLQDTFRPLHISAATEPLTDRPTIAEDGLALLLPAFSGFTPLRLSYAHAGRRLFSTLDRRLAAEVCAMLAHATASRDAHERGANAERMRIARDMHDNMGAQLLSALHSDTTERKDTLIRQTISDLRDIVNNAARGNRTLEELFADLKLEALERLSDANIRLDWQDACDTPGIVVAPSLAHSLRSVLREVVSNAIRHSGARMVRVRIRTTGKTLRLDVSDDGRGLAPEKRGTGNGLSNLETRLLSLNGTLAFADAGPGLAVRVCLPLNASAAA